MRQRGDDMVAFRIVTAREAGQGRNRKEARGGGQGCGSRARLTSRWEHHADAPGQALPFLMHRPSARRVAQHVTQMPPPPPQAAVIHTADTVRSHAPQRERPENAQGLWTARGSQTDANSDAFGKGTDPVAVLLNGASLATSSPLYLVVQEEHRRWVGKEV